ncbi:MAG: prepilin-type N-terminal cleavage/methylation domain-containing protein [Deltaproteobacteria bacterium]|nr:prepilin-type N-terminal cleavage/methylation domain-containing protein [Deltaproteobacteria bacterium]
MNNPKRFSDQGFSLVELLIVVLIIGIIAQMAIPHLMQSKLAANEASAITTVRSVLNAETLYVTTVGSGKYASMGSLVTGMLVDTVVGSSTKDGYVFAISLGAADASFVIDARPTGYSKSGIRSFFSDETAVIRYTTADSAATSSSSPLGE